MKNKKGFTLTEILVVIAIIGIIILIAIPSILYISKNTKIRQLNSKKEALLSAAEVYGKNNISEFGGSDILRIQVRNLIYYGYATKEENCDELIGCIMNPVNNSSMNNDWITIRRKSSITQAKWGIENGNEVCATFDFNDNSGVTEIRCCEAYENCELTTPKISRTDYRSLGWSENRNEKEEENVYIGGNSIIFIAKPQTYYAITRKEVTVTFDPNGGTISGESQKKCRYYNKETKCAVEDAIVHKTGCGKVEGWFNAKTGNTKVSLENISNNTTVYAHWNPDSYTITYDLKNGSATNPSNYTVNTSTFTLNNPTKTGYTFSGWEGTGLSNRTTTVTIPKGSVGDRDYEAFYNANTYKVKYNKNNSNATGTMTDSTHKYDEKQALTPNGYSLTGYKFDKWNTNSAGTGTSYKNNQTVINLTTSNNGTVNLYAQWKGNKYTVKYDKNNLNATGTMSNSTYIYGEEKALTSNGYSLAGYKFDKWNTKKDGTGTSYSNKAVVSNLTTTDNGIVTLYAQWKAHILKIQYNGNGGIWKSTNSTYAVNNYGTVVLSADNSVYEKIVNYGSASNGFINYNGSYFKWTKNGYKTDEGKEYYVNEDSNQTGLNQNSSYSAIELARLGNCTDFETKDCTIQLKVNWVPKIYTVVLHKKGGSGGTDTIYEKYSVGWCYNSSCSLDEHFQTSFSMPTKKGYSFKGYYTEENGNGQKVILESGSLKQSDDKIKTAVFFDDDNLASDGKGHLYAHWNVKTMDGHPCIGTPNTSGNGYYYDSWGYYCRDTGECCQ